jgi:pimeloyl-ACP methyl ester carboxylesterase
MRRYLTAALFSVTLATAGGLGLTGEALAAGGQTVVPIDQSIRIGLRGAAASVVVTNPAIADVTLLDDHSLVVVGRSYGQTHLLVTDASGRTLFNSAIAVSPTDDGHIALYRGPSVANFSCAPRCERTPMPGEDKAQFDLYYGPAQAYGDRARNASSGGGSQAPIAAALGAATAPPSAP